MGCPVSEIAKWSSTSKQTPRAFDHQRRGLNLQTEAFGASFKELIRLTSLKYFEITVHTSLYLAVLVCTLGIANVSAADRCTARQAQQALTDQGYKPGPIDGALGKRTRGALRAFQKANELRASGRLNRDTCRQLTSPPEPTPSEESTATPAPAQPTESNPTAHPAAAPEKTQQPALGAPSGESATQASEAGTNPDTTQARAPAAAQSSADEAPAPAPEPSYKQISNPVALYRTAFGLHKSRSYRVAVGAFEHYLRMFGEHDRVPDALYWLSEGYIELGMDEQARASLEQFMTMFPKHRYMPKARSLLDGISPITQ
jgi:TolA-binding protein